MPDPSTLFRVGPPPHVRPKGGLARMHHGMVLALLPAVLLGAIGHAFGTRAAEIDPSMAGAGSLDSAVSSLTVAMGVDTGPLWMFGILGLVALASGFAVLVEYLTEILMRQPYRALDGHSALMGMLLALMLPPTVPVWVLLVGVAVTVFLGKQVFGGIGSYPMHPAVVGWLVLVLSWPNHVYPVGIASVAGGTTAAVALTALGGLVLWARGIIRPQITLGVLAGVAIFALAFDGKLEGGFADQFLKGHVVLAAFFLATDATTSPANRRAMWIYGLGTGFLIELIRAYGVWADAVPFAVILMNVMNPLLDRIGVRRREVAA
ncbi:RnfABCDGE type electron transport complex subunit D [bacterium]|nr:RnfABCDGE type electron transport complex subunit D [bacterium]